MRTLIACTSTLVFGALLGLSGAADAGVKASVTVTIRAEGTDMSGVVKSADPVLCAAERKVVVFKQKGARGGGDDVKMFNDTSGAEAPYSWSTGNTGIEGKFYAKVGAKPGCKADTSPTIMVHRNP